MIEWFSVKDNPPPIGYSVLVCVMPSLDSNGNVEKFARIERIRHVDNGKYFTHWAWINAPRAPNGHKQVILDDIKREDERKRAIEEAEFNARMDKVARMNTPEYREWAKEAFAYQDELDKKAAQKRAAKQAKD